MADFQFQPGMSDPVAKLRSAMDNMDGKTFNPLRSATRLTTTAIVEGVLGYHVPPEEEDYTISETEADPSAMDIDPQLLGKNHATDTAPRARSNLRLFPPPLFSRQGIPQNYKSVISSPCTLAYN